MGLLLGDDHIYKKETLRVAYARGGGAGNSSASFSVLPNSVITLPRTLCSAGRVDKFYHKSLTNTPLLLSFKPPYKKVTTHYSFILPFILSKIDWDGHRNVEFTPVGDIYYVGVFLLSLVTLFCLRLALNVIGYFFSIYLLQRYNIKIS